MDNHKLLNELKRTQKLLNKVQSELYIKPKRVSVKSLLYFYYRRQPEKLNHDNPGLLKKIVQLVSDRSVHFLLFMFGVVYPISIMGGSLTRTLAKTISIGTVSKYIVFDVTSNIFIYIFLLIVYMFTIMILSHYYKKKHLNITKDINRFMRNIYNQVLLYVINMFTIYATLIGTIFTISSSINKLKIVLMIALFFSLIIIPILSISLFVSTVSKINDLRI